jgi:hypothetical protein
LRQSAEGRAVNPGDDGGRCVTETSSAFVTVGH